MRFIYSIAALLCAMALSNSAFAEEVHDNCPEGMTEFENTSTGTKVCLPDTLDEQTDTDVVVRVRRTNDSAPQELTNTKHKNPALDPGWQVTLGAGYGFVAQTDVRFMTGYHFAPSKDKNIAFGLYLDMDIKIGWPDFWVDTRITPTLHAGVGRFLFSAGLGIGFVSYENEWEENKYRMEYYFELAPVLSFDWYLTQKAYWGFDTNVPIILIEEPGVYLNINLHLGYKF